MVWLLALVPVLGAATLWITDAATHGRLSRRTLGGGAVGTSVITAGLATWVAITGASASYRFGSGIDLVAGVDGPAGVMAVLVTVVTAVVLAYAAAHEPRDGLGRLLALLTAFAGAMELLVVAEDLLTLLVGWELVGAVSWALIGFEWRTAGKPAAAAHAFNATRFGDLGLFLAAGAAFAGAGSFAYADLGGLSGTGLHVLVAGVVLAAAAKSGQALFAPWLFSAMAGPTSVSALLHSSTMVAAGAYLLVRLHDVLGAASWFGPTVLVIGLATAVAGGAVAVLQAHAKRLLAASTSAQYGLMFVAVGAGYPLVALAHLVVHAVFKAHLFLSAGVAMEAAGTPRLGGMRLGRQLPATARWNLAAALSLAAVPPLGGAWSKEEIVAAAGHDAAWLAVGVIAAGGLSAAYATRFHLLAFGRLRGDEPAPRTIAARPTAVEQTAMAVLGTASLALGLLWLPAIHEPVTEVMPSLGEWPAGPPWEIAASIFVALAGVYAVWTADRHQRLGSVGTAGGTLAAADWLGLPTAVERGIVRPALALAATAATFDDRVVDAGVRGVAALGRRLSQVLTVGDGAVVDAGVRGVAALGRWWSRMAAEFGERGVEGVVAGIAAGIGAVARDSRRFQTGQSHQYYVGITAGLALLVAVAILGR